MDAKHEEFVALLAATDAALAQHLQALGFDPVTGQCRDGAMAEHGAIAGCGSQAWA